jgi:peptidoglycan/xylan/chitin deacetylase (PgdA/CDA1 family)
MLEIMNQSFVTISIDDGHPTDLRARDLLEKYGLKATFYVPARNQERAVMSQAELRSLGTRFEIGGHTLNHVPLKMLPKRQAWAEINDGKKWLEDLLGIPVFSFCYPRGKFNAATAALVEEAGFLGARTCLFNLNTFPRNPFLWGVSTHASSHSPFVQVRHALLEGNLAGAVNFFRIFKASRDWESHFSRSLEYVARKGGIAHLYFHSWEIDNFRHWEKLERVFRHISADRKFISTTNGELYRLWNLNLATARRRVMTLNCSSRRDGVYNAIYAAITELNLQLPKEKRIQPRPDTVLFGNEGKLDSLWLANFIVMAEQKLDDAFGIQVDLTRDDPFSTENGHFRTVESLARYASAEVENENNNGE